MDKYKEIIERELHIIIAKTNDIGLPIDFIEDRVGTFQYLESEDQEVFVIRGDYGNVIIGIDGKTKEPLFIQYDYHPNVAHYGEKEPGV